MPEELTGAIPEGLKLAAGFAVLLRRLFSRFPQEMRRRGVVERSVAEKSVVEKSLDRRQTSERRMDIQQRLRRGLWLEYHRVTESGKFEDVPRDVRNRSKLVSALLTEGRKYHFRDRETGTEILPALALEQVVDRIWPNASLGVDGAGQSKAVYLVEAVAHELYSAYLVTSRDHRPREHRAAAAV